MSLTMSDRTDPVPPRPPAAPRLALCLAACSMVVLPFLACASGEIELPNPRRLVVYSGARIVPTQERMEEVDAWVREQVDSIRLDPSFWIISSPQEGPVYPWEELRVNAQGDSATVSLQPNGDALWAYQIYAHLHLMAVQDRLDRWLPAAVGVDEFELEMAILARVADVWLYQRSIFDARPYSILDEITYASENGFLEEFILTARPDAFVEARKEWRDENPDGNAAYLDWFRRTFERDPPGYSRGSPDS